MASVEANGIAENQQTFAETGIMSPAYEVAGTNHHHRESVVTAVDIFPEFTYIYGIPMSL